MLITRRTVASLSEYAQGAPHQAGQYPLLPVIFSKL
jgi:hypothetical protein